MTEISQRPSRQPGGVDPFALILVLLGAMLATGFFSTTWRTGDDIRYIGLARSLLQGDGYTLSHLPHDPPETLTPPAQPALIALATWLGGGGLLPGRILGVVLFLAGALFTYRWARQQLGDRVLAFGCAVMAQFAFAVLTMSCWYMVEMNYIAASYGALCLAGLVDRKERGWLIFLLGLVSGYVYLVRATGLALAAAGGVYFLLIRKSPRGVALFAAGFLLMAIPWMLRTWMVTGSVEAYLIFSSNLAGTGASSAYPWLRIPGDIARAFPVYYLQSLPDALFYRLTGEGGLLGIIRLDLFSRAVQWILMGLVTLGFLRRLRSPRFADCYWVFYWLIICAPPVLPQGNWYVYPMLGLAAVYLVEGLSLVAGWICRVFKQSRAAVPVRMAVALMALYTLATASVGAFVHFGKEQQRRGMAPWAPERYETYENDYMSAWGRMIEAGLWVASNYPPDTLILSRKADHVYFVTGHEGWRYDAPEVPGSNLYDRIRIKGKTRKVVLVEDAFKAYADAPYSYGAGHWALRDLFDQHGEDFALVHELDAPVTRVWEYRPRKTNGAM